MDHDTASTDTARHSIVPWVGRVFGPFAAAAAYLAVPAEDVTHAGRVTIGLIALMATWWMTQALPLPATALMPIAVLPLVDAGTINEVTAPYASDVIFLFAGGFLLAQAVQRWGLHRRIAMGTVLAVGTSPRRLIGGFMLATGFLSMWISNTATAVMMLPVGISVLLHIDTALDHEDASSATRRTWSRFGTALMLAIGYAASIGSIGTLIGTPPNGILAGYLAQQGTPVGFGQWMLLGVPLAVVFGAIAWLLLTFVLFRMPSDGIPGGRDTIRDQLRGLGKLHKAERATLAVFLTVAAAWIFRPAIEAVTGVPALSDAGISITGALLLFAIPVDWRRGEMVLDWEHARKIPWDILVLFGGGLSLAAAIERNGVASYVGNRIEQLTGVHIIVLMLIVALVVVFVTEVASNTAAAAIFIPMLAATATGLGIEPLALVLPATVVATFAFMLPVATPPNAVVFSSGRITVGQMARTGLVLNLIGVALAVLAMLTLAPLVFERLVVS